MKLAGLINHGQQWCIHNGLNFRPTQQTPHACRILCSAQQSSNQGQRPASRLQATLIAHSHETTSAHVIERDDFRRGVGLCIVNQQGLVFAAKRMDDRENTWQMPQGGIDMGENPRVAALRELYEETGMISVRIVTSIDQWLDYEFPTKVKSHFEGSWLKYRGQTQKWFLLEFHGDDSEVDLALHGTPEFSEWCWMPLAEMPHKVVDFKRGVYEQVARKFSPFISSVL